MTVSTCSVRLGSRFASAGLVAAALGACLSGCLAVTEGPTPMCETTADCDGASGEVCSEGVCYGNPPEGPFAALGSPPSERTDLVSRELLDFAIARDGTFAAVQLEEPVSFSGALVGCQAPLMCDGVSLDASITVTRRATFAGGPSFRAVFATAERQGFQLRLPRTRGEESYTVTIMPSGRNDDPGSGTTAAQLVPPLRMQLQLPESLANQTIELGGAATNHMIQGAVLTSAGTPVSQYRVVALGRWEPDAPLTEVSTVDYTGSDGTYSLRLSDGLSGEVQIAATSYNAALRPSLLRTGVRSDTDSLEQDLTLPEGLGTTREIEIPVTGVDGSGAVVDVVGARVTVVGTVMAGLTRATITAEGTTDIHGTVKKLQLLDGGPLAETYRVTIVPPAGASMGVVLDEPFEVASRLAAIRLPDRIAIRGVLLDYEGRPVKDAAVTARPSLRFLWSLPLALQDLLAAIPPATTVTPETGEFVVWVDRELGSVWGHYDLAFEATTLAFLPSFTQTEIELPRDDDEASLVLPEIYLPDAAFVRGSVVDAQGAKVEGAELKVYRIPTAQLVLCGEVDHAPASCPIPAQLLGRGATEVDGDLRLTLPRL